MGKIDRLRDAFLIRENSIFIDSIYDFSEEEIVGLTEQEFNEILEYCSKIKLDKDSRTKILIDFGNKGTQALENATIGQVKENILIGRFYLSIILSLHLQRDINVSGAILNLGIAHKMLAELGIDSEKNILQSIILFQKTVEIFPEKSTFSAMVMANMGHAHLKLMELGIDQIKNIEKCIKLQQKARNIFPKKSTYYGESNRILGRAYQKLAELGIDPVKNIGQTIKLQQKARKLFSRNRLEYAQTTMNLGSAYALLTKIGVDPIKNIEKSIKLQQEAINIFPKNNLNYARSTFNFGNAHLMLIELGIEHEKNFKIAEDLYEISKNYFLDIKDGWGYSSLIINNYILYRTYFWLNGDKNLLEKASNSLKDAKNNIEKWEVVGKNEILGSLCATDADLFELNEDYYNAGMKYRDAYRLTGYIYYKFMDEFCEAKSSKEERPFYQLLEKWDIQHTETWKKYDAEGILLDFYDYAVFECHLEDAVDNEALRFYEINEAKNKLDEIFSRTQIQHIKTRVEGCIDILNAYLEYFPEKNKKRNEEKVKENISSACRIFKSQGYQHEIKLCNMFIEVIKNKDKQEVWLELIKNNLSNNLSKLIGEAAITELIKSQTERKSIDGLKSHEDELISRVDKFQEQILTISKETKADIEEIKVTSKLIEMKTDKIIEYIQKIETSCNQIIYDIEKGGVKLKNEEKEELKTLAGDLMKANQEQLTNFKNEFIKLLGNPELQKELEKGVPKELKQKVKKTFSNITTIFSELGIALGAAVTAEGFIPQFEIIMHQISILSGISPTIVSTLILLPLITLKLKTIK